MDTIYGPTYGVKAVIPPYWLGLLPQESQVFTLLPSDGSQDNIFVFAREEDLKAILARWKSGIEISDGVTGTIIGEPTVESNRIYAEFSQSNDPKKKVIGEAKCGEFGNCATIFAFTDDKNLEKTRNALVEFANSMYFVKPGLENIYDNFDWVEYLSGKYIFSYQSNQYYRKENNVWLCADGTFRSQLKRTGVIKEDAKEYKGKKKGTYEVSGKGQFGTLILNFDKLPAAEIPFEIRDDKIYVRGIQQFVSKHSTCK